MRRSTHSSGRIIPIHYDVLLYCYYGFNSMLRESCLMWNRTDITM